MGLCLVFSRGALSRTGDLAGDLAGERVGEREGDRGEPRGDMMETDLAMPTALDPPPRSSRMTPILEVMENRDAWLSREFYSTYMTC